MGHSLERIRGKYKGGESRTVNIILFKFIKFYCNVKPPEGGCLRSISAKAAINTQHTATRRWLQPIFLTIRGKHYVSTHSHPKVAAIIGNVLNRLLIVSTHSHPKVAAPYIKKQEKSAN